MTNFRISNRINNEGTETHKIPVMELDDKKTDIGPDKLKMTLS